jgi:hypothetical protein
MYMFNVLRYYSAEKKQKNDSDSDSDAIFFIKTGYRYNCVLFNAYTTCDGCIQQTVRQYLHNVRRRLSNTMHHHHTYQEWQL